MDDARDDVRQDVSNSRISICAEHRSSRRPRSGVTSRANPTIWPIWPRRIGDGARFTRASGAPMPPANPSESTSRRRSAMCFPRWRVVHNIHPAFTRLRGPSGTFCLFANQSLGPGGAKPKRCWVSLGRKPVFLLSPSPPPPSPRLVRQQAPNMICLEGGRLLFGCSKPPFGLPVGLARFSLFLFSSRPCLGKSRGEVDPEGTQSHAVLSCLASPLPTPGFPSIPLYALPCFPLALPPSNNVRDTTLFWLPCARSATLSPGLASGPVWCLI